MMKNAKTKSAVAKPALPSRKELDKLYAAARAETERMSNELKDARELAVMASQRAEEIKRERDALKKSLDEARENFGILKPKYARALTTIARLTGYLDRVYEDDVVREDVVMVQSQPIRDDKAQPKRPPPYRPHVEDLVEEPHGTSDRRFLHGRFEERGGEPARKHWTQM